MPALSLENADAPPPTSPFTVALWPSAHSEMRERRQRRRVLVVALAAFAMTFFGLCLVMLVGVLPQLMIGRRGGTENSAQQRQGRASDAMMRTASHHHRHHQEKDHVTDAEDARWMKVNA